MPATILEIGSCFENRGEAGFLSTLAEANLRATLDHETYFSPLTFVDGQSARVYPPITASRYA